MNGFTLDAKNIAQLEHANIEFGDLTLLVGPQASGKSIFLQLFKLLEDSHQITSTLKRYGYSYQPGTVGDDNGDPLLTLVFGEGMGSIWRPDSTVAKNNRPINLDGLRQADNKAQESVFFIPAQRVLTLDQGRPRRFESFDAMDPFVVKSFSENLRRLMDSGLGRPDDQLFPIKGRLKKVMRDRIDDSIFHGATVTQQVHDLKKRIVINAGDSTLPFMAWSAGQREFMPLLFSLYWLMPSAGADRRKGVDWVVIEEPEMGLHPKAIQSVLLICLELMSRGYRVVISTHSPLLLEAAWVIRSLQDNNGAADALFDLFELPNSAGMKDVFDAVLNNKKLRSYYFEPDGKTITTRDISSLDPMSESDAIADWGGITQFSSRASDVISRLFAELEA